MTRKADILIRVLIPPALLVVAASAFGQTERSYPYAHIRYAEGDLTLQRALEADASEGGVNVPVMPGDRLWTATGGRAEVLFANGSVLQMDERTKVDFTAFSDTGAETLLRLWQGSLFLRIVDASAASYRIDTPAGSVFPASEGLFRIDVDETGTATLSVYEGVAELASGTGSVLVRTGQRSFVQQGVRPESPFEFNTALYDAFASWSDGRELLYRQTGHIEGVPDEVAVYAGDLRHHGSWRHHPSYGVVWYPRVSIGWSPYTHGRWCYTSFGWTWVSHEPWGWAPYHYGRWGHGSLGWYWIPGAHWGPAWVSWAFGPTWVGWSPLGYHNRPIFPYRSVFDFRRGRALPRHITGHRGHGWSFVKKDHFRPARPVPVERTRLRVEDVRATARQGRLFESGAILDRELRPVAVGASAMTRRTGVRNRTTERSAGSAVTRGRVFRQGPRGATVTLGGATSRTDSRGSAVPRFAAPGGSGGGAAAGSPNTASSVGRSAGRETVRGSARPTAGRARSGAIRRDAPASTLERIRAGVQRGHTVRGRSGRPADTTNPRSIRGGAPSGVSPSSPAPRARPSPTPKNGPRGMTPRMTRGAAAGMAPSRGITTPPGVNRSTGRARGPDNRDAGRNTVTTRAPSRRSPDVTRGPTVERSKGISPGSKAFFDRRPSRLGGPRSETIRPRAVPRAPRAVSPSQNGDRRSPQVRGSNRSSSRSGNESSSRSGNRDRNRSRRRD